jgi:hypothetical protein
MKRINISILGLGLLCVVSLASSGCAAWPYSSPAIRAKVVDSDGNPLQGVTVVATWDSVAHSYLTIYSESGPPIVCSKLVNLTTVTSGADGKFELPAWGPKSGCLMMYGSQPELFLYKPGYKPLRLLNTDADFNPTEHPEIGSNGGGTVFIRSTSRWDGKSIQLTAVEARSSVWDGVDERTSSLRQFEHMLPMPSCFLNQVRPAVLATMQEERRVGMPLHDDVGLAGMEDVLDFDINYTDKRKPPECAPPAGYLEGLIKEADQTPRGASPSKLLKGSPEWQFEMSNPDPWTLPAMDMPVADDLASGSEANKAVIYHVNLYPDNPTLARVYMSLPEDPQQEASLSDAISDFNRGVACAYFGAPTPAGGRPEYLHVTPPALGQNGAIHRDLKGYPTCYVLRTLLSPEYVADMLRRARLIPRRFPYSSHPSTYDSATRTFVITEMLLPFPAHEAGSLTRYFVNQPEYVEIDGVPGMTVTTDLAPSQRPGRWLMPSGGQPFEIKVVIPQVASPLH